ncbi:chalcone isomerase family protein [Aliamphritea hakodatensis]|uniref:chalcone isomerase family protein n=1 Tax=Aliamphritea hakodatensis TaxID=2895352 RepID=UPI0022FD9B90|nr:chalcone isomerase family protein [Aliamphritea hakodatensis]
MFKHLRYCLFCVFMLLPLTSVAELPKGLRPVGEASLSFLWYDVYQARLFNLQGQYDGLKAPLVLQIIYRREITGQVLIEQTANQLRNKVPEEQIQLWLQELASLWPDIRTDDQLTFHMKSFDSGDFYFNGRLLGNVEHPGFARAFINIWLADDGRYSRMAKQLRGEPAP